MNFNHSPGYHNQQTIPPLPGRVPKLGEAAPLIRKSRGYFLRDDLVKRCKRLVLEKDRKLYSVMEEAIEQYLTTHGF